MKISLHAHSSHDTDVRSWTREADTVHYVKGDLDLVLMDVKKDDGRGGQQAADTVFMSPAVCQMLADEFARHGILPTVMKPAEPVAMSADDQRKIEDYLDKCGVHPGDWANHFHVRADMDGWVHDRSSPDSCQCQRKPWNGHDLRCGYSRAPEATGDPQPDGPEGDATDKLARLLTAIEKAEDAGERGAIDVGEYRDAIISAAYAAGMDEKTATGGTVTDAEA